jgi:hypothetical protein
MAEQAKGGKKARKFGRHADRSPSMKVYKGSRRWEINAKKRMKRHTRRMAKKAIHRIEWEIAKNKTTLQASASRLQELRQVLSQNH